MLLQNYKKNRDKSADALAMLRHNKTVNVMIFNEIAILSLSQKNNINSVVFAQCSKKTVTNVAFVVKQL
jgi:hypothetical protein